MNRYVKKLRMSDIIPLFLAIFLAAGSIAISGSIASGPNPQDKIVLGEEVRNTKNDPVIVGDIRVRTKAVAKGEAFEADDDWLKNLSFKLHNGSDKTVTYMAVDLVFPETAESGLPMLRPLQFGHWPGRSVATRTPLLLKPNETLNVSLEGQYAALKSFLESRQPIGTIKKVKVAVYVLFFEDGTRWDLGVYSKPDPTSPTGYSRIKTSGQK